ncbi:MAG: tRNA lysidine(34) synthetase TilS [Cyanobacteria bacterium P01_H01_bin.153]
MESWSILHAQLHQTLKAHRSATDPSQKLLPSQASLLVAVSGGQDSQCLLRLLVDLQRHWQWQIHVVHCNHRWREDAAANADFVAQWSAHWALPCTVETAEQPLAREAAARQWRYRVFAQVAQEKGCTHVVTGHTASDRAETLLFNLVRGSGLNGLQALTWQRSLSLETPQISLVRPLLEITREQTGAFCREFQVPVWEDATNRDRTYRRNRLRLDVLPLLREHFNPQVDATLAQTAEILTAEVAFLSTETVRIYDDCVDLGKLQRRALGAVPLALQRRVVRQWLMEQLAISPHFDHVEKVLALVAAPNRSQTDPFPGGAIAIVEEPWIRINHRP